MTANNDELRECREAFEAWMKGREGYPFAGQFADLMWKAWQAAWNTRANEAKGGEAVAELIGYRDGGSAILAWRDKPVPVGTTFYTSPRATAEDVRDAKRYRRVRGSCGEFVRYAGCGDHHLLEDDKLDQAIDAAMAEGREVGNG